MLITYKTILSDKKLLVNNIYLFTFKPIEPLEINFTAGQYVILKVPKDNAFVPRLYSIASAQTVKNSFELIIEIIPQGLASGYIDKFQIGQNITFQGTTGEFTLKENEKTKIFLVTGTGIAPVRSMLNSIQYSVSSIQLFWGLKTYKDVYLLKELKDFTEKGILNYKICLSQEQSLDIVSKEERSFFELGHVDSCFDKLLNTGYSILNTEYYLCGRRDVVESLRLFLLGKNILQENIHYEKF